MKRYLAGLLAAVMLLSTMGTGALAEPVAETNVETIEAQTSESPAQAAEEKIEEPQKEKKEQPAEQPKVEATKAPVEEPAEKPAEEPTEAPAVETTEEPSAEPTEQPSEKPTEQPSEETAEQPSEETTAAPSEEPTEAPSEQPTKAPSEQPTKAPSEQPTKAPSEEPTVEPSEAPTVEPRTAAELAEMLGFETVEALAEAMEMDVSELEALNAEEIAALYAQLTDPSLQAAALAASDFTVEDGVLTAYTGSDVDVVIPGDLGITAIGSGAFQDTSIQSVVIPEGVTEIRAAAFDSCSSLKSVTFPSTLKKIGTKAFRFCGLTSVDIPGSVESIGEYAFIYCDALANVNLHEGLKTVKAEAFSYCRSITEVRLPESLTVLEGRAFYNCSKLESVDIPGSVESIGTGAFSNCSALANVNLHEGLKTIQPAAFSDCTSLTEVRLPESLTGLGNSTFYLCSKLESVYIPGTVTTIPLSAFSMCSQLKTVRIGEGIAEIGLYAFSNCTKLQEITLPEGLTRIGMSAFAECSALTKVALPSSLEYIDSNAFGNNYALRSIVIPENVSMMGDDIFKNCDSLTVGVYPGSVALTYCQTNSIPYVVRVPQVMRSAKAEQKSIDAQDCAAATFTVTTSKDAQSLKLCAESGAQLAVFTAENAQVAASDDALTWTFDYTFAEDGERQLSLIAATADGVCVAWPIAVSLRGAQVMDAAFPDERVEKGKAAQIRVTTSMGADTLCMYDEAGELLCSWPAEGNSTVSGGSRVWSVTYAFSTTGSYTMTFRALCNGAGGQTSASAQVNVELPLTVESVSASTTTVTVKETLTFTVKTSTNAKYVQMYSEDGSFVKSWAAEGNSTVSGSARIWTLSYVFDNEGERTLTFRASSDGTRVGEGKSATLQVLPVPRVISASKSAGTVTLYESVTFTVYTSVNARFLKVAGSGYVRQWSSEGNSEVSGDRRVWTVEFVFDDADRTGDCYMTAEVSADGVNFSEDRVEASVWVDPLPDVTEVSASTSTVTVGEPLDVYVITAWNARYLTLYSESGTPVKTWNCEENSEESEGELLWTVEYAFGGTGDRRVTLKTSIDGVRYDSGKELAVKVLPLPAVTKERASLSTVTVGKPLTFKATTPEYARYLTLYAEGGFRVKTWSCEGNSRVSDDGREWAVEYTFGGTGDRRVTLKASADGVHYGGGRELAVKVLPVMNVLSASASAETVMAQETMTFTATTPADASVLVLFSEGGTRVKSWSCGGNSTVSGSVRTWKVQYAFGGAGDRRVTLKASADGANFGEGRELAVKVLPLPGVTSASASMPTVSVGTPLTFTATTPANAQYLTLYAEGGTQVKTWSCDGNSTVSGDVRTWKVQYAFGNAGDRRITLRASVDGAHYGSGRELAVKVLTYPSVLGAAFSSTTVNRGESVNIIVMALSSGNYLHMYLENGQLYRTWASPGNSTVFGGVRIWSVPYSFSAAGARRLTFRVSTDGVHAGAGMTASITVK